MLLGQWVSGVTRSNPTHGFWSLLILFVVDWVQIAPCPLSSYLPQWLFRGCGLVYISKIQILYHAYISPFTPIAFRMEATVVFRMRPWEAFTPSDILGSYAVSYFHCLECSHSHFLPGICLPILWDSLKLSVRMLSLPPSSQHRLKLSDDLMLLHP